MGIIQSSINQTLGTAAIAARLSPTYEKRQKLNAVEKKENILLQQQEIKGNKFKEIKNNADNTPIEDKKIIVTDLQKSYKDAIDVLEEHFSIDPTKELYDSLSKIKSEYEKINPSIEGFLEKANTNVQKDAEMAQKISLGKAVMKENNRRASERYMRRFKDIKKNIRR